MVGINIKHNNAGSAANTARQLAIFPNIQVHLCSAIGKDSLSDQLVHTIKDVNKEKCDLAYLIETDLPTPSCIVLSGDAKHCNSERTFVTCNGALKELLLNVLQREKYQRLFSKMDHLHIGGYYNSVGLHTKEFLQYLKDYKEKHGFTISLDTQTSDDVAQEIRNHVYGLMSMVCNIFYMFVCLYVCMLFSCLYSRPFMSLNTILLNVNIRLIFCL